jgi:dihydroorotate dehydrogenase electron transfer subunit
MHKVQENGRVIEQQEVGDRTFKLRLAAPAIAGQARAGQFLMLQVHDGFDPLLKRPFSFHRVLPEQGIVEILYRVVGRGTWRLSRAGAGTLLQVVGPLGNGFRLPSPEQGNVLLVAGGIGLAPLHELILQLAAQGSPDRRKAMHLFYGVRTAAEMIPTACYADLGLAVHISTDDGSFGHHGHVTQLLAAAAEPENPAATVLYGCGPLAMQYHVAKWAVANHVAAQLSLESVMACGIGACLGCALPAHHPLDPTAAHFVHVCKDGPIFDAGSIAWSRIQHSQAAAPSYLYS